MIIKVNNQIVNLAQAISASIKPEKATFWLRDDKELVFLHEEAAALHSYLILGKAFNSTLVQTDFPFVDILAHYRVAQKRDAEKAKEAQP
jgi:hypothetical protein